MSASSEKQLHGVVFDLDGTLTEPYLDSKKLRRLLGIKENEDVLGHIDSLTEDKKKNAMQIRDEFLKDVEENMKLQPGICELFQFLRQETELKLALVTRNNKEGVQKFLQLCIDYKVCSEETEMFSIIHNSEFRPAKPDPASLRCIAAEWSTKPENLIMIGDTKMDMFLGKRAGATTILLNNEKNKATRQFADLNADSLLDVKIIIRDVLENGFTKKKIALIQ